MPRRQRHFWCKFLELFIVVWPTYCKKDFEPRKWTVGLSRGLESTFYQKVFFNRGLNACFLQKSFLFQSRKSNTGLSEGLAAISPRKVMITFHVGLSNSLTRNNYEQVAYWATKFWHKEVSWKASILEKRILTHWRVMITLHFGQTQRVKIILHFELRRAICSLKLRSRVICFLKLRIRSTCPTIQSCRTLCWVNRRPNDAWKLLPLLKAFKLQALKRQLFRRGFLAQNDGNWDFEKDLPLRKFLHAKKLIEDCMNQQKHEISPNLPKRSMLSWKFFSNFYNQFKCALRDRNHRMVG